VYLVPGEDDGFDLWVTPAARLTPAHAALLREHKPAIVAYLSVAPGSIPLRGACILPIPPELRAWGLDRCWPRLGLVRAATSQLAIVADVTSGLAAGAYEVVATPKPGAELRFSPGWGLP
jgi:hypothetical protein